MVIKTPTIPEIQEAVKAQPRLLCRAGGSKQALSGADGSVTLDVSGLSGVLEYQAGEFVFTALAGTPLLEIEKMLSEKGQYLPFDPPLADAGATLGGTVAAGLSGPMRWRYGGVRDFILGAKFVDGEGSLVRGGGRVVKNAAGFDLPKLMVGSLGRLGVLVELSFKVFPVPQATRTLRVAFGRLEEALEACLRLAASAIELYALDFEPPAGLALRLGGLEKALEERSRRLWSFLGKDGELLEGEREARYWRGINNFGWAGRKPLVKVALTPGKIAGLEAALLHSSNPPPSSTRRYHAAGHLLYMAWDGSWTELDTLLKTQGLAGLVLAGNPPSPALGINSAHPFGERATRALDPQGKFAR